MTYDRGLLFDRLVFRMGLSRLAGTSDLDKAVQKDVRFIIKAIHDGNEFAFYEAILSLGSNERKYIQDLMKRELPQFAVQVDQHSRRALKDKVCPCNGSRSLIR